MRINRVVNGYCITCISLKKKDLSVYVEMAVCFLTFTDDRMDVNVCLLEKN